MALINQDHPALQSDPTTFWTEEISNSKILLYEIDKAIDFLTKNKYARYTIDTGQDNMSVQYADLPSLFDKRVSLIKSIQDLEGMLGIAPESSLPSAYTVRPV
jgi:hypothetical protein